MTTTKLFALLSGALLLSLASCGTKKPHTPEPTPPSQVPIVITPPTEEPRWVRPAGDSIREEMRAVWLTTVYGLDWPRDQADTPDGVRRQKESLLRILDRLKSDGYNTVFLQLRHSGTVIYPSDYEPLSTRFAGEGFFGDYDPVQFAIKACHERGLSLHAWLVTYPLSSSKRAPHPILRDHPSWAIAHKGSYHLDPGHPEVRTYIAHLVADLVRRYPVDGIHFDYFRYPEGAERFADGASYQRYGESYSDRSAWRRSNLTRQLREVRDSLQAVGSDALVSVAPLGKLKKISDLGRPHGWTAYESVHQDPETWGKEGLVDFVVPMMYYRDELYSPFLREWKDYVARYIPVVAGLAPYRVEETGWPESVIEEQIAEEREVGLSGVCFFREAHTGTSFPATRRVIRDAFRRQALPLAFARGLKSKPAPPRALTITPIDPREFLLSWSLPEGASREGITYRLWATTTDSEGRRQATILAERLSATQCKLHLEDFEGAEVVEFGIEAVNRFGVSTPCLEGLSRRISELKMELRAMRR